MVFIVVVAIIIWFIWYRSTRNRSEVITPSTNIFLQYPHPIEVSGESFRRDAFRQMYAEWGLKSEEELYTLGRGGSQFSKRTKEQV